jgi:predicted metallopeptidase
MTEFNLPEKDDAPWLDTTYDGFMTHEEMIEEAYRRELANKTFEELTKDEKIKLALEELAAIVMGGQDGEEYYNSVKFIKDVLESLKDT